MTCRFEALRHKLAHKAAYADAWSWSAAVYNHERKDACNVKGIAGDGGRYAPMPHLRES